MISTVKRISLTEINEIQTCLNFIVTGTILRPRLGAILYSSSAQDYEKGLAEQFISFKDVESKIFLNSLLIATYGIYEKFIREICIASIKTINLKYKNYDELREKVRNQNILLTGKAFSSIFEPLDHFTHTYEDLVKNISTCTKGSCGYSLNSQLFGLYHNILNTENIERLFGRMDINVNWDEIAKNGSYETIYGQMKTRDTSNQIQLEIDNFVRSRNVISHTGPAVVDIPIGDIKRIIEFLKIFFLSFSKYLENYLKKY